MTRDRYLEMKNQLGEEPIEAEIPPDWEDFPEIVVYALNTYNMLGDRIYPEIGFIGKDYTNLKFIKEEVESSKKLFKKNNWPVIDVTRKSVEETAASILKIIEIKKNK